MREQAVQLRRPNKLQSLANRLLSGVEFSVVVLSGWLLGIRPVVRYLKRPNPTVTVWLLRYFGATIGENTAFKGSVTIDNAYGDQNSTGDLSHLVVGRNCYLGEEIYLDLANRITIEDDVVISGRVAILTHADCNRSTFLNERFERRCEPVAIRRGAWLGFGASLLCGVEVGENAVVAAGALLLEDADAQTVYRGIPAKAKKVLSPLSSDA